MSEDISKKAVMILVVIAVVISVLSTTLVMNAVYNYIPSSAGNSQQEQAIEPTGRASLTVPQHPETASGRVALTVNPG